MYQGRPSGISTFIMNEDSRGPGIRHEGHMSYKRLLCVAIMGALAGWPSHWVQAQDLKITLPQHSKATPVQRLNREGVEAVRRHQYDKAKTLFYRAFLFDPEDPFTLNNLGYMSELEGNAEGAQRFYSLAVQHASNAVVDKASSPQAQGKLVQNVVAGAQDFTQTNSANREAVRLLSKGRATEANSVLQRTVEASAPDAFTLNNIGVAKEMQGDLEGAGRYYSEAVNAPNSAEAIIITSDSAWRGKTVNEMAAANARKIHERLQAEKDGQAEAVRLSFRGVSALNRNDRNHAREYFQEAFALDPDYSFSLNNIGYLAELDGDLETAQDFYERARAADRSKARIGLATRSSAEGMKLSEVAKENDQLAEVKITEQHRTRLQDKAPIKLQYRNRAHTSTENTPSTDESKPK
jgi:Flp pilus assembly protein TadD